VGERAGVEEGEDPGEPLVSEAGATKTSRSATEAVLDDIVAVLWRGWVGIANKVGFCIQGRVRDNRTLLGLQGIYVSGMQKVAAELGPVAPCREHTTLLCTCRNARPRSLADSDSMRRDWRAFELRVCGEKTELWRGREGGGRMVAGIHNADCLM